MKIRTDFVSNSSSTSFVVAGVKDNAYLPYIKEEDSPNLKYMEGQDPKLTTSAVALEMLFVILNDSLREGLDKVKKIQDDIEYVRKKAENGDDENILIPYSVNGPTHIFRDGTDILIDTTWNHNWQQEMPIELKECEKVDGSDNIVKGKEFLDVSTRKTKTAMASRILKLAARIKRAQNVVSLTDRMQQKPEAADAFNNIQLVLDGTNCEYEGELEECDDYVLMQTILRQYGIEGGTADELMNAASQMSDKTAIRAWNEYKVRR